MPLPYLIVVTGRPGSGKSTLADILAREWHMPLVSRDRIKEGLIRTEGLPHAMLPDGNLRATQAFFADIECMLSRGISIVAEAAFQHKLWNANLLPLADKARISLIICAPDGRIAQRRFTERRSADMSRVYYHGDDVSPASDAPAPYNEPVLPFTTVHVDTADGYSPSISDIYKKIFGE